MFALMENWAGRKLLGVHFWPRLPTAGEQHREKGRRMTEEFTTFGFGRSSSPSFALSWSPSLPRSPLLRFGSPSDLVPIQSDKGIKIFLPLSPIWAALQSSVGDVSGGGSTPNRGRCSSVSAVLRGKFGRLARTPSLLAFNREGRRITKTFIAKPSSSCGTSSPFSLQGN